jgi:hypothetical protein
MTIEDWILDDDDENSIECKFCGKSNLHWENYDGCWMLVNNYGKVHKCKKKSPEDFMESKI